MQVRFRLTDPRQLIALGFGAGLIPRAPGTAGTLLGLPFAALLGQLSLGIYLGVVAAAFLVGCWLCDVTARAVGVHDHPAIVWDEFVGLLIALAGVTVTPLNLVIAFLLFRLFDILKPWPIRALDRRLAGGFGIMLDDAVAGVFTGVVLYLGRLITGS